VINNDGHKEIQDLIKQTVKQKEQQKQKKPISLKLCIRWNNLQEWQRWGKKRCKMELQCHFRSELCHYGITQCSYCKADPLESPTSRLASFHRCWLVLWEAKL